MTRTYIVLVAGDGRSAPTATIHSSAESARREAVRIMGRDRALWCDVVRVSASCGAEAKTRAVAHP